MARDNSQNIGCIVLLFLVCGLYTIINETFIEPKRRQKQEQILKEEQKELEKIWTKPTIDFFKNFNCSDLKYEDSDFQITKFMAVDSYLGNECYIDLDTDINYDNYKIFDTIYTRKINEANTIIWIIRKRGKVEGTYTGGEKAIRLLSEINFIDKSTKTIFKKINVDYLGVAPEKITRTNYNHMDEEFGERDNKGEYIAIINEIKRQSGLPPLN